MLKKWAIRRFISFIIMTRSKPGETYLSHFGPVNFRIQNYIFYLVGKKVEKA